MVNVFFNKNFFSPKIECFALNWTQILKHLFVEIHSKDFFEILNYG